jgi:acyl-CoA thioester hydrolase
MPRIKLQEQPDYEFRYEYTVQHRDINMGVHLGNDAIIILSNVAMMNMFRRLGLTDVDLGDGKTGKIMVDLCANYKGEGHIFDVLQIDSHIGEITYNSFRIFHRVTRGEELLALVETGFLAFDYELRKSAPIPAEFLQTLQLKRLTLF